MTDLKAMCELGARRKVGNSGLEVSRLGLGTWQLGNVSWRSPTRREIEDLFRLAWDVGVNLIDTSPSYGNGEVETMLGQLFQRMRLDFVVFSKIGLVEDGTYRGQWDSRSLNRAIETTLRMLGRDYVDVLALHSPPPIVAKMDHIWKLLEDVKVAGKARFIGLSLEAQPELARLGIVRGVDVVQLRYNCFFPETLGVITDAQRAGVGVLVNSPLAHGLLSGQYASYKAIPDDEFPKGPFRQDRSKEVVEEQLMKARRLQQFAEARGMSLVELALRFALAPSGACSVIAGQRTRNELEENVAAIKAGGLPQALLDEMNDLVLEIAGYSKMGRG